ncbi:MAG: hypothetical protein K6U14_11385 [Firmicutes bacterium]|nr:hypothetical protein [Alicyclobacillaceae bacterium]MCL6498216.1 hypothetical protein [Bacillota bacterium]
MANKAQGPWTVIASGVEAPPPDVVLRPSRIAPAVWKSVLWAVVLSRLFFAEAAMLAYIYLPHAWVEAPPGVLPPAGGLAYRVLVELWSHWDGLWYLSIAHLGYRGRPTATAFFPLYPALVHLFGGTPLAAVTVSMAAMAVAFWLFFRLAAWEIGLGAAWYATLALAFFPTAFYINAAYSESLFLALALGCLYLARLGRYWMAGAVGAVACLDSSYGLLLTPVVLWLAWRQGQGGRWRWLAPLAIPAGLVGWMAYLVPLFGDPMVFERAQSNWGRHFSWIPLTLAEGLADGWRHLGTGLSWQALFAQGPPSVTPMVFYNALFAVFAVAVWALSLRRLPAYASLYAGLALAVPLSYPAEGDPLMSMPRLVLEAFPLFWGLGAMLADAPRWGRRLYFGLSLVLGALFVALFATAHWVA